MTQTTIPVVLARKDAPQEAVDLVRILYRTDWSTREIAALTGYSKSFVANQCRDILRPKSIANKLCSPPTSRTWRACRAQARKIVERGLGCRLPSNLVVHHIDGDYTNNDIYNLAVMSRREHSRQHILAHPVSTRKDTCIRGHTLSGDNIRIVWRSDRGKFERYCRACANARRRKGYKR